MRIAYSRMRVCARRSYVRVLHYALPAELRTGRRIRGGSLSGYHKHCDCHAGGRAGEQTRIRLSQQNMSRLVGRQPTGKTMRAVEGYAPNEPEEAGGGITVKPDMHSLGQTGYWTKPKLETGQIIYDKPRNSFVKKKKR